MATEKATRHATRGNENQNRTGTVTLISWNRYRWTQKVPVPRTESTTPRRRTGRNDRCRFEGRAADRFSTPRPGQTSSRGDHVATCLSYRNHRTRSRSTRPTRVILSYGLGPRRRPLSFFLSSRFLFFLFFFRPFYATPSATAAPRRRPRPSAPPAAARDLWSARRPSRPAINQLAATAAPTDVPAARERSADCLGTAALRRVAGSRQSTRVGGGRIHPAHMSLLLSRRTREAFVSSINSRQEHPSPLPFQNRGQCFDAVFDWSGSFGAQFEFKKPTRVVTRPAVIPLFDPKPKGRTMLLFF